MGKLNVKQKRFAREYILDLNATQAAIRAGYSKRSAYSQGQRLLKHAEVGALIQEFQTQREERTEVTADMVIKELAAMAFVDPSRIVNVKGGKVTVTDTAKLTEAERRTVSSMSQTVTAEGGTVRVKMHDKTRALELLGRHLGMFRGDVGDTDEPMPVKIEINVVDGRKK